MHFYFVRHLTKFLYTRSVSESTMEVRMHPRSDSNQRCLSFTLSVSPQDAARIVVANVDHGFVLPGSRVAVLTESDVTGRRRPHRQAPPKIAQAGGRGGPHQARIVDLFHCKKFSHSSARFRAPPATAFPRCATWRFVRADSRASLLLRSARACE